MINLTRRSFGTLALAAAAAGLTRGAYAGSYPAGPIKFVVGLAAGGSTDITARLLAAKLEPIIGQNVIVENRPGAGSMIAAAAVARADADGKTFFVGTGSFATNAVLSPDMGFNLEELVPVVQLTSAAFCIAVHPSLGIETIDQLVARATAEPGKIKYCSTGAGGQGHFAGELFKSMAGVDMVHVPYAGAAPALTAVLSGEVPVAIIDIISYKARVTKGELRLLGVTSSSRAAAEPDVPTLKELGFDKFDVIGWSILFAPKGVAPDIVALFHDAAVRVADDQDFRSKLTHDGGEIVFNSQAEVGKFFADQIGLYRTIAANSNIRT